MASGGENAKRKDHKLGHRGNISDMHEVEMLQTTLSDNNATKQEFTNKTNTEKSWKLNKIQIYSATLGWEG